MRLLNQRAYAALPYAATKGFYTGSGITLHVRPSPAAAGEGLGVRVLSAIGYRLPCPGFPDKASGQERSTGQPPQQRPIPNRDR